MHLFVAGGQRQNFTVFRTAVASWAIALTLPLVFAGHVRAAATTIDKTFGNNGVAGQDLGHDLWQADSAMQSDGKTLVLGNAMGLNGAPPRGGWGWLLARYNTDGSLDTSFGISGIVKHTTSSFTNMSTVSLQANGKILVGGLNLPNATIPAPAAEPGWRVVRLNANGSFDTSFGNNGYAQMPSPDLIGQAWGIAIATDGKVVVSGYFDHGIKVVRYTPNGTLDIGFGTGGIVSAVAPVEYEHSRYRSYVAVQPNGKVILQAPYFAYNTGAPSSRLLINRFNANGSLDTAFGTGGTIKYEATGYISPSDLLVRPDGTLLSLVWRQPPASAPGDPSEIRVHSYTASGQPNANFGNAGAYIGTGDCEPKALIPLDQTIIIGTTCFSVWRLTANGVLDTNFGTNGRYRADLPNLSWSQNAHFQPGGRIIFSANMFAGTIEHTYYTFGLAGYRIGDASTLPPVPTPAAADTNFRPSVNGFTFANFDKSASYYRPLSLESFDQFFGSENTRTDDGQLRESVRYFYDKYGTHVIPLTEWGDYKHINGGGSCFGFSGAALLNFLRYQQPNAGTFSIPIRNQYSDAGSPTFKPGGVADSRDLVDILGYYQGTQRSAATSALLTASNDRDAPSKLIDIKRSIHLGLPIQIAVYQTTTSPSGWKNVSGHSVLAYRYQDVTGGTDIYVYDNNYPNNNNLKINFKDTGTWSYAPNPPADTWGSAVGRGTFALFEASGYLGKGVLPWGQNELLNFIGQVGVAATITTPDGRTLGMKGGDLVDEIEGAAILPVAANTGKAPTSQTYYLPSGTAYTLRATNTTDTPQPLVFFGDSTHLTIDGLLSEEGDTADTTLLPHGKGVVIRSPAGTNNYRVTLTQEIAGESLTLTASGLSLRSGEQTTLELTGDSGQLRIKNEGEPKTYTLQLRQTGGANSSTTAANMQLAADAVQTWAPTSWDNLTGEPIKITTTRNTDGTVIGDITLNALTINDGASAVRNRNVTLRLAAPFPAQKVRISNTPFHKGRLPNWQAYTATKPWQLTGGDGKKTVYVQYQTPDGAVSSTYSVHVHLDTNKPVIKAVVINNGRIVAKDPSISIKLYATDHLKGSGITRMRVSEKQDFSRAAWQPYASPTTLQLTPLETHGPGLRHIYVQLEDAAGNVSATAGTVVLLQ